MKTLNHTMRLGAATLLVTVLSGYLFASSAHDDPRGQAPAAHTGPSLDIHQNAEVGEIIRHY